MPSCLDSLVILSSPYPYLSFDLDKLSPYLPAASFEVVLVSWTFFFLLSLNTSTFLVSLINSVFFPGIIFSVIFSPFFLNCGFRVPSAYSSDSEYCFKFLIPSYPYPYPVSYPFLPVWESVTLVFLLSLKTSTFLFSAMRVSPAPGYNFSVICSPFFEIFSPSANLLESFDFIIKSCFDVGFIDL